MRMPFFRRKNADPSAQPARFSARASVDEISVQAARTRARRRLIGALVLLVAGVVGFPVLFETQPRPLPVDTPILVPEGTAMRGAPAPALRPLPVVSADAGNEPVAVAAPAPLLPASAALPAALPPPATAQASAAVAVPAARAVVAARAPAPAPALATAPAPAVSAAPKPESAKAETAKPAPDSTAAASGRFVVQVGAYNDPERLRAARQKVEKLGYKTYTQEVDSPTGKRTRVRVGPFASRQEADAVATQVKASGMQANILAL